MCSVCKVFKSDSCFAWTNKEANKLYSKCKECNKAYQREHYLKNKSYYLVRKYKYKKENQKKVIEYLKNNPCVDCGETDIRVLDFDHIDRNKKSRLISQMYSCSWSTLLEEIKKCEIRCANCHRIKTSKQFGWLKND